MPTPAVSPQTTRTMQVGLCRSYVVSVKYACNRDVNIVGHNAVEAINRATRRTKISSYTIKVRNQGRREIVSLLTAFVVVVVVVVIVVVIIIIAVVIVVVITIIIVVILYDMSTSCDLIAEAVTINATITIVAPVLVAELVAAIVAVVVATVVAVVVAAIMAVVVAATAADVVQVCFERGA